MDRRPGMIAFSGMTFGSVSSSASMSTAGGHRDSSSLTKRFNVDGKHELFCAGVQGISDNATSPK
jgi:hypothetical protein